MIVSIILYYLCSQCWSTLTTSKTRLYCKTSIKALFVLLFSSGSLKHMSTLTLSVLFCSLTLMQKLLTCFLTYCKANVHAFKPPFPLQEYPCLPSSSFSKYLKSICGSTLVIWAIPPLFVCNPNEWFNLLGWQVVRITHISITVHWLLVPPVSFLWCFHVANKYLGPGHAAFTEEMRSFILIETLGSLWYKNGVLNSPSRC